MKKKDLEPERRREAEEKNSTKKKKELRNKEVQQANGGVPNF